MRAGAPMSCDITVRTDLCCINCDNGRPVVHAGFVAVAAHPLFQTCRFCTGFYAFSATSDLNASSVRTGCACWSHCYSGSSCVIWLTPRLKNRFFLVFHPCRTTVGITVKLLLRGILCWCLASLVWHSPLLLGILAGHPVLWNVCCCYASFFWDSLVWCIGKTLVSPR